MYGKMMMVCVIFVCADTARSQDVQSQRASVMQKIADEESALRTAEQKLAKEEQTLNESMSQQTALQTQLTAAQQELTHKASAVTAAQRTEADAREALATAQADIDGAKIEHQQAKIMRNKAIVLHSALVEVETAVQTTKIATQDAVARYNPLVGESVPDTILQSDFMQLLHDKIVQLAKELESHEEDTDAKGAIVRQKEAALKAAETHVADVSNVTTTARQAYEAAEKEVGRSGQNWVVNQAHSARRNSSIIGNLL